MKILSGFRLKAAVLLLVFTAVLSAPFCAFARTIHTAVLCYHGVTDNPLHYDTYRISAAEFESDLQYFTSQGYTFLLPREMWNASSGAKNIVLTFDDGYEDFDTVVYPLLQKYGVKAAVFIIGSKIDKTNYLKSWQIKELYNSGLVEIGNHTTIMHTYEYPLSVLKTNELIINEYIEDVKDCSARVAAITGRGTESFSYPNGRYTERLDRVIRDNLGYTTTFSTDYGLVYTQDDVLHPMDRIYRIHGDTPQKIESMIESLK